MRIVVEELSVKGFEVVFSQDDAWASAAVAAATHGVVTELKGKMRFERARPGVAVDVTVTAKVVCPCDRCGVDAPVAIDATERLIFWPEGYDAKPATAGEERELEPEELDVGWFADGAVLTDDVLAEVIVLNTPNRILCEDEVTCLAAIKPAVDDDASQSGHPAFAALKARLRT